MLKRHASNEIENESNPIIQSLFGRYGINLPKGKFISQPRPTNDTLAAINFDKASSYGAAV